MDQDQPKKPRTWLTRKPGEKGIKKLITLRMYDVDKDSRVTNFGSLQKWFDAVIDAENQLEAATRKHKPNSTD